MYYDILKASKVKAEVFPDYWTQLFSEYVGGKSGWTVSTLTGTLPLAFRSNSTALIDYRIYGTADGAGVQTDNYGYKIPITVKNGTETKTTDVYIGDSKLDEAEYIDYSEQKIYKRILFMTHNDKHFITKDNKDFCLRRTGYNG